MAGTSCRIQSCSGFRAHARPWPRLLGVVRPVHALSRSGPGADRWTVRVAELGAVPRPEAALVQNAGDGLFAAVLGEELIHEFSHRGFVGAPGRDRRLCARSRRDGLPAEGLVELGPDGHRRLHAVGDLLALPLGHDSPPC
jgi:hypothetical protein